MFKMDAHTFLLFNAQEQKAGAPLIDEAGNENQGLTASNSAMEAQVAGPNADTWARRADGVNGRFFHHLMLNLDGGSGGHPYQTGDFTLELVFASYNKASGSTGRTLYSLGGDDKFVWLIWNRDTQTLSYDIFNTLERSIDVSGVDFNDGEWWYLAVTKTVTSGSTNANKLSTIQFYLNRLDEPWSGVPIKTQTGFYNPNPASVSADHGIGTYYQGGSTFPGSWDFAGLRASNVTRTLAELRASFQSFQAVGAASGLADNRWLATNIVRSLKLRGLIPTGDVSFTLDDYFFLLDEGLRNYVVPILRESNQEDYLTRHEDLAVTAGTSRYPIPQRAASEQLVAVQLTDGQGGWVPLSLVNRLDAHCLALGGMSWYIDDDAITLAPAPTGTGTLRVHYVARPGRIVDETACGRITAFDATVRTVTLDVTPVDVTADGTTAAAVAFTTVQTFDFVRGRPGFRCLAVEAVCTGIASNVMTFSGALPTDLAVGDYVCIAGESPIAQVPEGAHPLLAAWAAYTCEMSFGNSERVAAAKLEMDRQEKFVRSLVSQQKGSTPNPVINVTSPGWSRLRRRMR